MSKASDNEFPSLLLKEGSAPASPAAGDWRLFFDSADHLFKMKNSSGTVTGIGGLADQGVITYLDGTVAAAPATPATGKLRLYAKTGKVLAVKDDAGLETVLGQGIADQGNVATYLDFSDQGSDPASPSASHHRIYAKAGGFYDKDSSGTVVGAFGAGGGGGVTIRRPALTPSSPTDDFAAASLDAAWSVHSNGGTFASGDIITQGQDWIGSAVELQYSAQCGTIYRTHSNTDLDFTVCGVRSYIAAQNAYMFGIAALDTSGNGVGVTCYTDGNIQFAGISAYSYASFSEVWNGGNSSVSGMMAGDWWFRLKRISGTWTGYASRSGRVWDHTFSTRADSVTVAQLHFGILYNAATTYNGRLIADAFQLDA